MGVIGWLGVGVLCCSFLKGNVSGCMGADLVRSHVTCAGAQCGVCLCVRTHVPVCILAGQVSNATTMVWYHLGRVSSVGDLGTAANVLYVPPLARAPPARSRARLVGSGRVRCLPG
jgi:hypothetical protein